MAELTLDLAIPRMKANEDRFDRFMNGGDSETFTTSGSVVIPSVAKFLKDKNTEINVAAGGILSAAVAARDIAVQKAAAAAQSAADASLFDPSSYYPKTQVYTKTETDTALATKLRVDAAHPLTTAQQKVVQASIGAVGHALDAKSANYTVLTADNGKVITVDATGGARTITLPAAASAGNGFKLIVKKTDASANVVTVDPNAAELVDGAATKVLRLQHQSVALICDGTAWHSVSEGSVFVRGSNANGEYVRYADGTQICWNTSIAEQSVTTATGQVFRSAAAVTWTFPATFVSVPALTISATGVGRWTSYGGFSVTSVDVYQIGAASSPTTTATAGIAIGRWF